MLIYSFLKDQTMADERRQNELRRKLDKLHQSRQLYEALQAKNHEMYACSLVFFLFRKFYLVLFVDK